MIVTKTHPASKNLSNVFDELFNGFSYNWKGENNFTNAAPVNITETADGYQLAVSAPGRKKEDFKINIDKGLLTISFEQQQEAETKDVKTIRREFSVHSFKRSFSLDEKINADAIDARYENGILNVFLPKKEEVKVTPKQIQIQ